MGLGYQETLTLSFDMVDVRQELKIPSFLAYCLALSNRQSELLGRGEKEIFEQYGLVWVVTDYEADISHLPRYQETITIETEASSYNTFFCYRTFRIYDVKGNLLIKIFAYFVLIDFETRKVRPIPEELIAPYQAEKVKKVARTPKYGILEEATEQEREVRYFDIDLNGHVNNSKYLEWMYESLDYEFLSTHRPTYFQLKYIKEVVPEALVTTKVVRKEDSSQHEIWSNGQLNAQGMMKWRIRDDSRN
ncbi:MULTISPECIES: acyl-ACP thioesterase domain-containing protein [unclassified Streptococcus]|uniref:acyl-ACP thioesterase domain-containing protein n=1 Tax=unclassified Streptococcus TaxID=2608887 RepID=UPI0010725C49|nr:MULTISPECIES: acyl-ACP thioesterase domain-containing protein [unclassified Streptococcus]MBF0786479.1 acyl-[acyl-carrier-protein] thioesterase [Streptococcus sp. 19428wC2_LYSM12]MCQ9212364.1 thioesterase [Streptococcus sp. B01]MCQ9213695.1 thioesterase [Streptococcus sp. O1]TFV06643.1 acyl-[acyl-carrier-protein] thioesterase [Streptococcus sp. LYSM12]